MARHSPPEPAGATLLGAATGIRGQFSMSHDTLKHRIAVEAARLIASGQETHLPAARIVAARAFSRTWVRQNDLPSDLEIRHELQRTSRLTHAALTPAGSTAGDRFLHYRQLLEPLAHVQQPRDRHPEGDALYHSLQVFDLAWRDNPWDEELLLAALLHDVGKGIDPLDHVAAGLEALDGSISQRTAWLIEYHSDAHRIHDGSIGQRALRRLRQHEDFDALLLLARCDRAGRVPGAVVPDLDAALAAIAEVAQLCDEEADQSVDPLQGTW